MQELKDEDEHAYALLDSVPRCQLAACFLPAGVYNYGVRTSNWIEILWEVMRRIGLRKERSFLNQLVFFVMYSVVRYRHLVVKARALRQQESVFSPTKEMATTLVSNSKFLVDRNCTVKQVWDESKQQVMYSVKVPVRHALSLLVISNHAQNTQLFSVFHSFAV